MPRTVNDERLRKHALNLYEGDFDRLLAIYSSPELPPSVVIRKLIRAHIEKCEAKAAPIPEEMKL